MKTYLKHPYEKPLTKTFYSSLDRLNHFTSRVDFRQRVLQPSTKEQQRLLSASSSSSSRIQHVHEGKYGIRPIWPSEKSKCEQWQQIRKSSKSRWSSIGSILSKNERDQCMRSKSDLQKKPILPSVSAVSYVNQENLSMLLLASVSLLLLLLIFFVYRRRSAQLREHKLNEQRRRKSVEDDLLKYEPFESHISSSQKLPTILEENSTLSPSTSYDKLTLLPTSMDMSTSSSSLSLSPSSLPKSVVTEYGDSRKLLSTPSSEQNSTSISSADQKLSTICSLEEKSSFTSIVEQTNSPKSLSQQTSSSTSLLEQQSTSPSSLSSSSSKQKSSSIASPEQKPSNTSSEEQKPPSTFSIEQKHLPASSKTQDSSSTSCTEQKSLSKSAPEQQSASVSGIEEKPSSKSATEDKPSSTSSVEKKPSSQPTPMSPAEQKTSSTSSLESKSSSKSTPEQKPSSKLVPETKSSSTSSVEEKPSSKSVQEKKPSPPSVLEQTVPSTSSLKQKPSSKSIPETKTSSTSSVEQKPSSKVVPETKPSSTSSVEQKPSSKVVPETKLSSTSSTEKKPSSQSTPISPTEQKTSSTSPLEPKSSSKSVPEKKLSPTSVIEQKQSSISSPTSLSKQKISATSVTEKETVPKSSAEQNNSSASAVQHKPSTNETVDEIVSAQPTLLSKEPVSTSSSSSRGRRSRFEQDSTQLTTENPSQDTIAPPPVIVRKVSVVHENVIKDDFKSIEEINDAVKEVGLVHSQLIFGIDYTISNLETGRDSFHGYSLHHIQDGLLNPYQSVITIVGRTLEKFDADTLIPAFGFGDRSTLDRKIFPLRPDGSYCNGFRGVLEAYNEITPKVRMSGPTNFAPLIREAVRIVKKTGEYHILVIVADGQVTNERQTKDAIVEASNYPLSIVMIGVGDGPWDMMEEFDDSLPTRQFDNFQFVNYNSVVEASTNTDSSFALHALMEIPSQYAAIKKLGLLGKK